MNFVLNTQVTTDGTFVIVALATPVSKYGHPAGEYTEMPVTPLGEFVMPLTAAMALAQAICEAAEKAVARLAPTEPREGASE